MCRAVTLRTWVPSSAQRGLQDFPAPIRIFSPESAMEMGLGRGPIFFSIGLSMKKHSLTSNKSSCLGNVGTQSRSRPNRNPQLLQMLTQSAQKPPRKALIWAVSAAACRLFPCLCEWIRSRKVRRQNDDELRRMGRGNLPAP